jgi:hypothetical protein
MNEIGSYTVTIAGAVSAYQTQRATTVLTIIITDPCLTTTINIPDTPLSNMTTSVLV